MSAAMPTDERSTTTAARALRAARHHDRHTPTEERSATVARGTKPMSHDAPATHRSTPSTSSGAAPPRAPSADRPRATRARCLLALAALAAAACGNTAPLGPPPVAPSPVAPPPPIAQPAPVRETPDAAFRETPPAAQGSVSFTPPKIESMTLKNGVKVLLVQRHEFPLVSVRVAVKGGAGDYASERPGVLSFVGAMLEQGTAKRSALQISDDYEAIGAQHGAWIDWDGGGATVKVLVRELDKGLSILSEVVTTPTFPEAEVTRLKSRRLAALALEKTNPSAMATNAVGAALYGRAHPYGNPLSGREEDAKKITRDELVRAYKRVFVPRNATIVVAGDVTREAILPKLQATFGGWRGAGGAPPAPPNVAKAKADAPRLIVVDRPNAPQTQVFLAEPGVSMSTPDRDALAVMNAILGGVFSSRINMNLREAHAYTYGAYSRFSMRHGPGPFLAGGAMVAEKTAPAVHELFMEIEAMLSRDVTPDELTDAKEHLKLALPSRFETVGDVTDAVADIAVYGLPLDEFATREKRIDAVTAADVKRVAAAHIHARDLRVVVVGDRAKISPELEALHLGTIEARDPYGDVVAPPK